MAEPLPPLGESTPLVPPLYQSSVYCLPDLDALDQIMDGEAPGFIYARDSHPNAQRLAEKLAELEGGEWALVCGSGMAAITVPLLSHVQQGDRIVASSRLYGRTTTLLTQELVRFGVKTDLVDPCDLEQVRQALRKPCKVVFVETMSNPLLRLVNIEDLAQLTQEQGAALIVDNTFATPVLVRPLDLGADLVMESLTKLIGGHSDVTLGVVSGRSDRGSGQSDKLAQYTQVMSTWGLASNPFDCWLAERGLATLPLRMRTASANAAALADWLADQRGVTQVIYPGRPEHPDHKLASRLLKDGFGNMLCFELRGGREAVNRFMQNAPGIPFSPSLGHTTTTCSHPGATSHRYVSPAEKRRQGIGEGLIRLSVGVEELEQIQEEMANGLG
jgi:cystathionine beta-lyase/cystathionine gamma-synthase